MWCSFVLDTGTIMGRATFVTDAANTGTDVWLSGTRDTDGYSQKRQNRKADVPPPEATLVSVRVSVISKAAVIASTHSSATSYHTPETGIRQPIATRDLHLYNQPNLTSLRGGTCRR